MILLVLIVLNSCSQNILNYKSQQYYEEYNTIESDSIFKLSQNICYNKPGLIDEEFCYCLTLQFTDIAVAGPKKILNLFKDTATIISRYRINSIWNWDDENNKITGKVRKVKWSKDEITLKENVTVTDYRRNKIKRYAGTVRFKKKDKQPG